KSCRCCRRNLDLGDNQWSGRVRSYGPDWGDCGWYWRDGRFWLKHEHFEANYGPHKAAEAHRTELISRMELKVVGEGEGWDGTRWDQSSRETRTRRRDCLSQGQHGSKR